MKGIPRRLHQPKGLISFLACPLTLQVACDGRHVLLYGVGYPEVDQLNLPCYYQEVCWLQIRVDDSCKTENINMLIEKKKLFQGNQYFLTLRLAAGIIGVGVGSLFPLKLTFLGRTCTV